MCVCCAHFTWIVLLLFRFLAVIYADTPIHNFYIFPSAPSNGTKKKKSLFKCTIGGDGEKEKQARGEGAHFKRNNPIPLDAFCRSNFGISFVVAYNWIEYNYFYIGFTWNTVRLLHSMWSGNWFCCWTWRNIEIVGQSRIQSNWLQESSNHEWLRDVPERLREREKDGGGQKEMRNIWKWKSLIHQLHIALRVKVPFGCIYTCFFLNRMLARTHQKEINVRLIICLCFKLWKWFVCACACVCVQHIGVVGNYFFFSGEH